MLITFTAYILIPVYTLLFVAGSDWFTTNFSVLGNIAGRNEAFVLWGLMVGIYFFVCLRKIFRHMPEKPAGTWLVPLALVLLDFAVTTPYTLVLRISSLDSASYTRLPGQGSTAYYLNTSPAQFLNNKQSFPG